MSCINSIRFILSYVIPLLRHLVKNYLNSIPFPKNCGFCQVSLYSTSFGRLPYLRQHSFEPRLRPHVDWGKAQRSTLICTWLFPPQVIIDVTSKVYPAQKSGIYRMVNHSPYTFLSKETNSHLHHYLCFPCLGGVQNPTHLGPTLEPSRVWTRWVPVPVLDCTRPRDQISPPSGFCFRSRQWRGSMMMMMMMMMMMISLNSHSAVEGCATSGL